MHEIPNDSGIQVLKQDAWNEKNGVLSERVESVVKNTSPKMKRGIELASEKGASSWLTVIPMSEKVFTLNKWEFRDALKLRYGWPIKDNPTRCACAGKVVLLFNATMNYVVWRQTS